MYFFFLQRKSGKVKVFSPVVKKMIKLCMLMALASFVQGEKTSPTPHHKQSSETLPTAAPEKDVEAEELPYVMNIQDEVPMLLSDIIPLALEAMEEPEMNEQLSFQDLFNDQLNSLEEMGLYEQSPFLSLMDAQNERDLNSFQKYNSKLRSYQKVLSPLSPFASGSISITIYRHPEQEESETSPHFEESQVQIEETKEETKADKCNVDWKHKCNIEKLAPLDVLACLSDISSSFTPSCEEEVKSSVYGIITIYISYI
jgi:hypothetical protein